ncbi:hypothetical protein IMZ31_16815 [Pontibacillus sp. ALD_SL1]|uniref:hypothetical protein n=1 Tax=Pontibacillus sp. ALD_SL1 TaxID=2777185 RepID=UPI001A9684F9|nr:hypothetical protein [Pontibacillus sp. ALD_SL1]QSS99704.1 hypothetical protein IMZ31_16815 [Pontibacillus sp. ALD_SL1]
MSAIAVILTALVILIPGFLFKDDLKAQANKGWSFYNEQASNMTGRVEAYKSSSIFNDEDEADVASDKERDPLGTIRVITAQANLRYSPEIPANNSGKNIAYVADEGIEMYYFDTSTADNGVTWYMVIHSDTKEEIWISGVTVEEFD